MVLFALPVSGRDAKNMANQPKKIVFVEDDMVVMVAYGNCLRRDGYHVETARDGLEALKILHASVPDLIVLDLMMPKFNGVEVFQFIRSHPRLKTVPVIIFSTNSIIDAEHETVLENASKRLIKGTCTASMLLAAARELLLDMPAEITARPSNPVIRSLSPILEAAAA
jgi:chemosensory pili system protein ChpA (sensor histidine kinase/response regulator)